ncbi:MAG: cell division protein SepF [Oscillospiraceae bacterium]
MGFKQALKNFIGIPDEEYFEEDEMHIMPENLEREKSMDKDRSTRERVSDISAGFGDMPIEKKNKVVNIHATTQLQVVLVKPERYEDATGVADHLNEKKTVVLNLEQTKPETARRILDFICGVAYANGGQVKKVASNTYIITPYNVDFISDLLDELESNGVTF